MPDFFKCKPGTTKLRNWKSVDINVGNLPGYFFYHDAVFSKEKDNIECLISIPPLSLQYVSIEMSQKTG